MEMLFSVIFVVSLIILLYLLYIAGYIQYKVMRAVMYVGSWGNSHKNYHKARLSSCTGYVKRIVRLKENRDYTFIFAPEISNGSVTVNIFDSKKDEVLSLDSGNRQGVVRPGMNAGYRLVINYDKAGGSYELNWK